MSTNVFENDSHATDPFGDRKAEPLEDESYIEGESEATLPLATHEIIGVGRICHSARG